LSAEPRGLGRDGVSYAIEERSQRDVRWVIGDSSSSFSDKLARPWPVGAGGALKRGAEAPEELLGS
jgi:hypothetical protein